MVYKGTTSWVLVTEHGTIRYHLPGEQVSLLVEELRKHREELRSLLA